MSPEQKVQQIEGAILKLSSGNECTLHIRAAAFKGDQGRASINVKLAHPASKQDEVEIALAMEVLFGREGLRVDELLPALSGERGARMGRQFVSTGQVADPHDN